MGCYDNIGHDKFPKQGSHLGKKAEVCFHFNTNELISGKVVRDDMESRKVGEHESPGLTIIALEDGRYVLSTECQYSIAREIDDGGPYNGLAKITIPIRHRLYYKVVYPTIKMNLLRSEWEAIMEEAESIYDPVIADVPGASSVVLGPKLVGYTGDVFRGFLISEDYSERKLSSIRSKMMPTFIVEKDFADNKAVIVAIPNKQTKKGQDLLKRIAKIESENQIIGSFASYVLDQLGLTDIEGFNPTTGKTIGVSLADVAGDVWFGIPSITDSDWARKVADLVDNGTLERMRYSELVAAQEDEAIAHGNYNGSDTDYYAKK